MSTLVRSHVRVDEQKRNPYQHTMSLPVDPMITQATTTAPRRVPSIDMEDAPENALVPKPMAAIGAVAPTEPGSHSAKGETHGSTELYYDYDKENTGALTHSPASPRRLTAVLGREGRITC